MEQDAINPDTPYALTHPGEQSRRLGLLSQFHMAPLSRYLDEIRQENNSAHIIPDFDPCDAGIEAKGLFLLDSPDNAAITSGFVSRNNLDYASKNLCTLMHKARIDRRKTLIWNFIPWMLNDTDEPNISEAMGLLSRLFRLLPELRVVVLIGKYAQSAGLEIKRITKAKILKTPYPFFSAYTMRDDAKTKVLESLVKIAVLLR